jgi:hypothetical protein
VAAVPGALHAQSARDGAEGRAAEAIAAVVRTIFGQPDHATAMTQLRKVADGLRPRFGQAAALLEDAAEDVLAYLNHRNSLTFFRELRAAMPFPIRKIQCNKGSEFRSSFRWRYRRPASAIVTLRNAGRNRTARSSAVTASTTKSFWHRRSFASFDEAVVGLDAWERPYNHERFSMALRGHTPSEEPVAKLAARPAAPGSVNRDRT